MQTFDRSTKLYFFGWTLGRQVVRRYIHMSGKDLDNTLLSISEGMQIQQQEYQLKTTKCNRCSENLSPTQQFCSRCGLSCDLSQQYSFKNKIMKENNELKQQVQSIREEMNNKLNDIMTLIQQNPKLSYVKPELLDKICQI